MRHVLSAALVLAASTASAYQPVPSRDPVPWTPPAFVAADAGAADAWASGRDAQALLATSLHGAWRATIDARTGVPGSLRVTVPVGAAAMTEADARSAAVAFARLAAPAFGVDASDLALRELAVMLDGRLVAATFAHAPQGVPVEGARLTLSIVRGRVVLVESERLAPAPPPDVPTIAAADALAATTLALSAEGPLDEILDAGSLEWMPRDDGRGGLSLTLAWRVAVRLHGAPSLWESRVDARTGAVLALFDAASYACPVPPRGTRSQARGGVLPHYPWDAEIVRGMDFARVRIGASTFDTDLNGTYAYPGGAGDSVLQGVPVRVNCITCSNPADALAPVDTVTGDVDFGTGGANTTGNGLSLKCERTSFYHGSRVHELARKWLPAAQVPDDIEIQVNYNLGTCNGVYAGRRIYLLQEDASCVNTGESPSVICHEWGHALDDQTGPGGDWGEGMADHLDWLTTRDWQLAPGFYRSTTNGLRQIDENAVPLRAWPAPECGGEVHCLGEVYGQADWHLCRLLRADARFGEETGWHLMESLFFNAIPTAGSLDPAAPGAVYEQYANVLDALFGDGNVLAGVPLASLLNAAFQHHGMAPAAPYTEEAYPCATPPQSPALTATVVARDGVTGRPRVTLTWSDPTGVPHDILRSEDGPNHAKLELATVPAGTTTYTDLLTDPGATYVYAAFPQLASGCYARMDALLTVTVSGGDLALESFAVDPGGDGVLTPGETVDVVPDVRNLAAAGATNVTATLEPGDPAIALGQPSSTVGAIPAGSVRTGSAWRVTLAAGAACDGRFDVPVRLQSDQGCTMTTMTLAAGEPGAAFTVSAVGASDAPPAANGNGAPEPGEAVDLALTVAGTGSDPAAIARAVTGTCSCSDPRATFADPTLAFGDVATGASVTSLDAARLTLDPAIPCGTTIACTLSLSGSNGCWRAPFAIEVAGTLRTPLSDDAEGPSAFVVGSDGPEGGWMRGVPMPVQVGAFTMPASDVTADPARKAWVTEAASLVPGADDVDGGCTRLTSPAIDLTGLGAPRLLYSFAFASDDPSDSLTAYVSDTGGASWSLASASGGSGGWTARDIDVAAIFGYVPASLVIRFDACDLGLDSVVEAMLDDIRVTARACEDPRPLARLLATQWIVDDAASGNGNGAADPGETLDVRVRLASSGVSDATAVSGTLSLAWAVPGVSVTGTTDAWPDIAAGADALDLASFRVALDTAVACGDVLPLALDATYESGAGPVTLTARQDVLVGALVPDPTATLVALDDEDGARDIRFTHFPVLTEDDWQSGTPQGLGGDPAVAASGANCWGTDLGIADPRFPRDGVAAASSASVLESDPLDLSQVVDVRLAFSRWLEVEDAARESARVLVNGNVAWENPSGRDVADTAWTPVDLDVSAWADRNPSVVIAFEIATDADDDLGGWTIDDVAISGRRLKPECACFAVPPGPVGGVLRVSRSGDDAVLDWSATASAATQFRVLRRVSARSLPVTGTWSPDADLLPSRTWTESDGSTALPLVFYDVRALDACGQE